MKFKTASIVLALAASLGSLPAAASVITFNGTAGEASATPFISTYTEAGYTLTRDAGNIYFMDNNYLALPGLVPFDDDVLEFNATGAQFTLTKNGGGLFNLISVSTGSPARSAFDYGNFIFTGYLSGGGTITTTVSAAAAPTTFSFSGFDSLTSVTVGTSDGEFPVMDNLTLTDAAVPEPASLALFGLGLFGLGWSRRKKA